jgi:putative transposase
LRPALISSQHTFYRWRRKYGGMDVSEAKKLKNLERENAELKRLVADLSLDSRALKELNSKKMVRLADRRRRAEYLQRATGLSERRSCRLAELARGAKRRASGCVEKIALIAEIHELSNRYPRVGYRKIFDRLKGAGWRVGRDRVRLLRRTEGLRMPRKSPRHGAPPGYLT